MRCWSVFWFLFFLVLFFYFLSLKTRCKFWAFFFFIVRTRNMVPVRRAESLFFVVNYQSSFRESSRFNNIRNKLREKKKRKAAEEWSRDLAPNQEKRGINNNTNDNNNSSTTDAPADVELLSVSRRIIIQDQRIRASSRAQFQPRRCWSKVNLTILDLWVSFFRI